LGYSTTGTTGTTGLGATTGGSTLGMSGASFAKYSFQ